MDLRDRIATTARTVLDRMAPPVAPESEPDPPTEHQDTDSAIGAAVTTSGGWMNQMTGMGIAGLDRNTYANFSGRVPLNKITQDQLWESGGVAQQVVDRPAHDMIREGYNVETVEPDPEKDDAFAQERERLAVDSHLERAWQYERKYGGGAIFLDIPGDEDKLETPLYEASAPRGIRSLAVYHKWELQPIEFYADDQRDDFGRPSVYFLQRVSGYVGSSVKKIHASRLIRFGHEAVPQDRAAHWWGWGPSVYDVIWQELYNAGATNNSASQVTQEFNTWKWKMKHLAKAVSMGEGEAIRDRIQLVRMALGSVKALVLDADAEDAERMTVSVAGLADLMDRFGLQVSAVSGIPYMILYGDSPSGLNATGEGVIVVYYDRVHGWQVHEEAEVRRLFDIMLRVPKWGDRLRLPNPFAGSTVKYNLEWTSLNQPTEKETAELKKLYADMDAINIINQVYDSDEARQRYVGEGFKTDLTLEGPPEGQLRELEEDPEFESVVQVPEAPSKEMVPPAAVSQAAADGRNLKRQAKRGGGHALEAMARLLMSGEALTTLQLREMESYYRLHAEDRGEASAAGKWADPNSPSAAWIDWLLMGGDPGKVWTAEVLNPASSITTESQLLEAAAMDCMSHLESPWARLAHERVAREAKKNQPGGEKI